MEPNTTAIERAFQLAGLGTYLNVSEMKERLDFEGYSTATTSGPLLHGQLKSVIETGRKSGWMATPHTRSGGTAAAGKMG